MTIRERRKPSKTPKYPVVDGVMTYPDGREVCQSDAEGSKTYKLRLDFMVIRQYHVCALCGFPFNPGNPATFGHERARGMGSAHRDDRLLHDDGTRRNAALHERCNGIQGSKRYHWISVDGEMKYVPVERVR